MARFVVENGYIKGVCSVNFLSGGRLNLLIA